MFEKNLLSGKKILITGGATGLGKTFVACALAHSAIRHRRSALYLHGPRMLDELAIARTDGPAHPAIGQLGSSRRPGQ